MKCPHVNNTGAMLTKFVMVQGKPRKIPGLKTINKWVLDGVAKATDGCRVEPDGCCPHGHQSWLLVLGYA